MQRWMYDAAEPPPDPPKWHVAAGYIGGDTPHVWTDAEWDAQWAPARLPIWTRTNAPDTREAAIEDASGIFQMINALKIPKGSTVAVDTETVIYRAYLTELSAQLQVHGFGLLNYGSLSYILQNARTSAGRWAAEWDDNIFANEQLAGDHGIVAGQWASAQMLGKPYDASWIESSVQLWHRAYAG